MYYSYNNNLELYFSLLLSIVFIISIYFIGSEIIKLFKVDDLFESIKKRFLNCLIGFTFINIILEYVVIFSDANEIFIQYFSYIIIIMGFVLFIKKIITNKSYILNLKKLSNDDKLILLIISLFFLVAIAPITNEDSLNYHLGAPLAILKEGRFNWHFEWFHFGLMGISEYINLLSLKLNAEQIPNLSQFFSLIAILGLLIPKTKGNEIEKSKYNNLLILIFLTTPVLLFLTSSAKPQLNGIALTSTVFFLILKNKVCLQKIKNTEALFIGFLLFSACATKLNFIISTITIFIMVIFVNQKEIINRKKISQNLKTLALIILTAIITFLPIIYKKISVFDIKSLKDLFIPVPSFLPGSEKFLHFLKDYKDTDMPFPVSLVFPSSIGNISMLIGLNLILIIFILSINKFHKKHILILILLFVSVSVIIGQNTSRFFFEPFVWLIIYSFYEIKQLDFRKFKLISIITYGLYSITLIILCYAVLNLSIGVLNINLREKVLSKNANGYILSKWVNSKLPSNAKICSDIRATVFFNAEVYPTDWCNFVNYEKKEDQFYINYLQKKGINYIVLVSNDNPKESDMFKYCDKLLFGPYNFKKATRNPFNLGKTFKAWIYTPKFIKNSIATKN